MFSNGNNGEFSAVKQQELEAVNGGLSLGGGFGSGFSSGDFGGAVSLPGTDGRGDLVSGGLLVVQPGASDPFRGPNICIGRQINIEVCGCQNETTAEENRFFQML